MDLEWYIFYYNEELHSSQIPKELKQEIISEIISFNWKHMIRQYGGFETIQAIIDCDYKEIVSSC